MKPKMIRRPFTTDSVPDDAGPGKRKHVETPIRTAEKRAVAVGGVLRRDATLRYNASSTRGRSSIGRASAFQAEC